MENWETRAGRGTKDLAYEYEWSQQLQLVSISTPEKGRKKDHGKAWIPYCLAAWTDLLEDQSSDYRYAQMCLLWGSERPLCWRGCEDVGESRHLCGELFGFPIHQRWRSLSERLEFKHIPLAETITLTRPIYSINSEQCLKHVKY